MKNWNLFKNNIEAYLLVCENQPVIKKEDPDFEQKYSLVIDSIERNAKRLFEEGFFTELSQSIGNFIIDSKNEISEYLINYNTRRRTIEKVQKEFDFIVKRMESLEEKFYIREMNNLPRFTKSYFPYIQPIYRFYDWFLIESGHSELIDGKMVKVNIEDVSHDDELEFPDLKTQKEQIRLMYDLGIIEFLISKYPESLKGNNNQLAGVLSSILKENKTSIQPSLNALMNNNASNKNYPKSSKRTEFIIELLSKEE